MQSTVKDLIKASRQLTPVEQLELLTALTESMYQFGPQNAQDSGLRLAIHALNRTPLVTDLDSFIADFWPDDETADEFNDFIYQQRHAERTADQ